MKTSVLRNRIFLGGRHARCGVVPYFLDEFFDAELHGVESESLGEHTDACLPHGRRQVLRKDGPWRVDVQAVRDGPTRPRGQS